MLAAKIRALRDETEALPQSDLRDDARQKLFDAAVILDAIEVPDEVAEATTIDPAFASKRPVEQRALIALALAKRAAAAEAAAEAAGAAEAAAAAAAAVP